MKKEERVAAFASLGETLRQALVAPPGSGPVAAFMTLAETVHIRNAWFTPDNVRHMIGAIAESLTPSSIEAWLAPYELGEVTPKNVAVIMAGNIPMVGFHDFLCVLISGNNFLGKLSSDDQQLLPALAEILCSIEPRFRERIIFSENRLNHIEAVIATGSNNSARYFEYYFGKHPHIIRRNRNAVAVLRGNETDAQLQGLGEDVFRYFGLGCRSVSKLFVPAGYDFDRFYRSIVNWGDALMMNRKYMNNYEYHRTLFLLNSTPMLDNNFLLLKEDTGLASPVGMLYYEQYNDEQTLSERLRMDRDNLQCVVGPDNEIPFGQSQHPHLNDYADGVDTMRFMLTLK